MMAISCVNNGTSPTDPLQEAVCETPNDEVRHDAERGSNAHFCAAFPSDLFCRSAKVSSLWTQSSVGLADGGKKVTTKKFGEVEVVPLDKMSEYLARSDLQNDDPPEEIFMTVQFNVAFYGNWFPEDMKKEFDEAHAALKSRGEKPGLPLTVLESIYAPNEGRFLDWISDRMAEWNKNMEGAVRGSLDAKRNLGASLGAALRWSDKLSPKGEGIVRTLFEKTDQLIRREDFRWARDLNRGDTRLALLAVTGDVILAGLVAKFAGGKERGKEKGFDFSELFKKGSEPKATLATLDSSNALFKPVPEKWQGHVWNFLKDNYDSLAQAENYWSALGRFVENNPKFIPEFVRLKNKWTSKRPDPKYGDDAPHELHYIWVGLLKKSLIPDDQKLAAYHYVLTQLEGDKKKNYHEIKNVDALERRLMADYLVGKTKEYSFCLGEGCDLGQALFKKCSREWGGEKTVAFIKETFPKEKHGNLSLSFRIVRLFIDVDPQEVDKFLAELQDPELSDLDAIDSDPLWEELWDRIGPRFFVWSFGVAKYKDSLRGLPSFLLDRGRKDIVERFYFENHPYAKLYDMPDDIRPTGKELSFVSIDAFADPQKVPHADKRGMHLLNGDHSHWEKARDASEATHGVATSAVAVGQHYGLAPDAELYIAPVDFKNEETLPEVLLRNMEAVIEKKKTDPSIAVIGMSFGLSVPHVFRQEAERSPMFHRLKAAAETLNQMDVALVAASGNDGSDELVNMVGYLPHVQLIGSLDSQLTQARSDDLRSGYTTGGDAENPVRFFAHADPILIPDNKQGVDWIWQSGTSFAQPHFSGVLLLMEEVNPTLSWKEHYQILEATSDSGSNKNRGKTIDPVQTIDPMEAIAVVAQRPGSRYQGDRLKRLLAHLGHPKPEG